MFVCGRTFEINQIIHFCIVRLYILHNSYWDICIYFLHKKMLLIFFWGVGIPKKIYWEWTCLIHITLTIIYLKPLMSSPRSNNCFLVIQPPVIVTFLDPPPPLISVIYPSPLYCYKTPPPPFPHTIKTISNSHLNIFGVNRGGGVGPGGSPLNRWSGGKVVG